MLFHDGTHKTSTTYKISTFFEDLDFLNPGSHLKARKTGIVIITKCNIQEYVFANDLFMYFHLKSNGF